MNTLKWKPVLGALLITSAMLAACSRDDLIEQTPVQPRIAEVLTLTLVPQIWQEFIEGYGVIEAAEDVDISVDFSAPVKEVRFLEGQSVEQGQILIVLDSRKRALRLQQAKTTVNDTKAALDEARHNLERRRGLAKSGAVSRELLETAEVAMRRAGAQYEDALAALSLAERELAESELLSPVSGLVERRLVAPGETVQPGQVLATVNAVNTVRVLTHVPERDVNSLQVGAAAQVTSPGVRGRAYTALIESVGIKADPRTGNFPVKLTLENPQGLLRSGMTARVRMEGLVVEDALLIPDTALVDRRRRRVAYLAVNNKAVEVEPLFGPGFGEELPVLDGLKAGDRLIISGLEYLVDGSPISTVDEAGHE